jgi:hypothetical protein
MSAENTTNKQPLIRYVNRQQMSWRAVDVERLIGEEHAARAIWALVGRLDLSRFYQGIESSTERGRSASVRSTTANQSVGVCLQPGDWLGAGGGATLRI